MSARIPQPDAENLLNWEVLDSEVRSSERLHRHVARTAAALEKEIARDRVHADVFESVTADPMVVTDTYGSVLQSNPAAARFFGVESRFLLQKPITVFSHPGHSALVHGAIAQVLRQTEHRCTLLLHARGETEAVSMRVSLRLHVCAIPLEPRILWIMQLPRPMEKTDHNTTSTPSPETEEALVELLEQTNERLQEERAHRMTLEREIVEKDSVIRNLLSGFEDPLQRLLNQVRQIRKGDERRDALDDELALRKKTPK